MAAGGIKLAVVATFPRAIFMGVEPPDDKGKRKVKFLLDATNLGGDTERRGFLSASQLYELNFASNATTNISDADWKNKWAPIFREPGTPFLLQAAISSYESYPILTLLRAKPSTQSQLAVEDE